MSSILGQNIKYLRKKRGLSQDELAAELGVSRSKIASYEGKGIEPRLTLLVKIADFFSVSIDALVTVLMDDIKPGDDANALEESVTDLHDICETTITKNDNQKALTDLIKKSSSVQKMLEGFKVFYDLKIKGENDDESPKVRELRRDIENILQLIEYLLHHNKTLVSALNNK